MKTKFVDGLYKHFSWLIIALSLVGYLFYQSIRMEGDIQSTLTDIHSYIHMIFVIFLNLIVVSGANDKGIQEGLLSEEFRLADELNNKLIKMYNNDIDGFRKYIRKLNEHERLIVEEDYLFNIGDKTIDELTKRELRAFKRLKPLYHNIFGFNLPLYYESERDGNVKYGASYDKRKGRTKALIKKTITGVLFGAMTVNMLFDVSNFGNALISLLIIGSGLITSYLMYFYKPMFTLKYELPKKVIQKDTLYSSYDDYKSGKVVLKEEPVIVEPVVEQEIVELVEDKPDEIVLAVGYET